MLINFLQTHKTYLFSLFFLGVSVDVLYYAFISDYLFFPLVALYIGMIFLYKIKSTDTLKIIFGFLLGLFIFYILDEQSFHTDRVTTWIFFLLFIGIGQQIIDIAKGK